MARKNCSSDAIKFAKSTSIFSGKVDNYQREPNLLLIPECQITLPVKGIDPDSPDKMYKIVSVHITGNAVGVAPKDQKAGRPSRFRPVIELSAYMPTELNQAILNLQRL